VKFKSFKDGEQSAEIPSLPDLLKAIATALVGKATPLTGGEVRFLRKRMGFSSSTFAEIIGTNPQHYSRLENSVVPLQIQTEKLIRLLYTVTAKLPKVAQKVATTKWEAGFDHKQNIIASKDTSHVWHVQFDSVAA
jgi:transcriptional regulator with XRE-family HTH domain